MTRAIWSGNIELALINVPVKLHKANRDADVHFKNVHAVCHNPINLKKWCAVCEKEVPTNELNKGFALAKDKLVEFSEQELEGLIIRDPKAPLGKGIWKLKRELTEDVYCKGEFTPPDSSLAEVEYEVSEQKKKGVFANLKCYQLSPDGKEVHVCDLGGGFGIEERIMIQKMLDMGLITDKNPLVLEVKANARYENGRLRHPTYLRLRDDKPWTQCRMEEHV